MKIWSNFTIKKCLIIKAVKAFKKQIFHMSLSLVLHYIFESQYKIWNVNQYKKIPFCDVLVK
jgi:hypothetical protein